MPPQRQHVLQELLEGNAQRLGLLAQERLVLKVSSVGIVIVTGRGQGQARTSSNLHTNLAQQRRQVALVSDDELVQVSSRGGLLVELLLG